MTAAAVDRRSAGARPVAAGIVVLALTALAGPGPLGAQQSASRPTLDLFPSQAIDSIRETSESAVQLEEDLQGILADLDSQMKLYQESKCQGAVEDQGCRQLSSQMASSYGRMLDTMAEQLPEMERSLEVTRAGLQKRIAQELGYRRTAAGLQDVLREQPGSRGAALRTRPQGEGVRLSTRFRQYYRLVSQGSGDTPIALVGAQMYVDLEETKELITLTRQQIQRGQVMANLSEAFGTVTPEMERTVAGVKEVVFGEPALGAGEDIAPADFGGRGAEGSGFCSEFDPSCP